MHIIFGQINSWTVPLLKILNFFKLKIFYIYINEKSIYEKTRIADELKKNKIYPLPLEFEKEISSKQSYFEIDSDLNENAYKKNIKLVPEKIINKYCNIFSVSKKNSKKIRIMLQDFIFRQHANTSGLINMWSEIYKTKKIVYVSFKFICFYTSDSKISKNILKIIIPLDILNYLIKSIKILFFSLNPMKNFSLGHKSDNFSFTSLNKLEKNSIALIPHKGVVYGTKGHLIFEKTLYYSDNINSQFNKHNILHLDYDNFSAPDKNVSWVCLRKLKFSKLKIFIKSFVAFVQTFYLIRSWNLFLGWLLCMQQYILYLKFNEAISKFKNLKIAIIDYDVLCPKTLILALEKNNVRTIATQERFLHTFYTSYANVILDTYFVVSNFAADFIKKSKYYDIKNIIPVGQYRSDFIQLHKKKVIPDEIDKAKKNGKKIIIALGYHSPNNWFESCIDPVTCWSAQINFLEDIINLSKNLDNTFIVLRYKILDWANNQYFENIFKRIKTCENIFLSNNYKESNYSSKLCSNADLVIGKTTNLLDECLVKGIPALFYEYTHNMKKIVTVASDYPPPNLTCTSFEELVERSKSFLLYDANKLQNVISKVKKTIYQAQAESNIKNAIITQLENITHD